MKRPSIVPSEIWQKVLLATLPSSLSKSLKKPRRYISKSPEIVLDAPDALDDITIKSISWSFNGNLLVALFENAYVWNQKGLLTKVYQGTQSNIVVSVGFSPKGSVAAVGTDDGEIVIYDFNHSYNKAITIHYQVDLSVMLWQNENEIVTGDNEGTLRLWDQRGKRCTKLIDGFHDDGITGLTTCPDENYFASGGNEGNVKIWDFRKLDKPVWSFDQHTSAVKAVCWCPWAPSVLATGGGLGDGLLHFYNTTSGVLLKSIDTCSQVCDLVWSKHYKEVLTAQACETNQLVLWKYPSGEKITSLPGHDIRTLNLALSPDGQTVASMGGDDSLKFWKCFATKSGQKPLKYEEPRTTPSLTIR